jgi:hypothetical protein
MTGFGFWEALTAFGYFGLRAIKCELFAENQESKCNYKAHSKISKSGKSFPHSKIQNQS